MSDALHDKGITLQDIETQDILVTERGTLFLWNAPFLVSKESTSTPLLGIRIRCPSSGKVTSLRATVS